jgi:hypothetical protein
LSFVNYWQLLKKKTNVNTIFIDNFENTIDFNEQNFANNVKNFELIFFYGATIATATAQPTPPTSGSSTIIIEQIG